MEIKSKEVIEDRHNLTTWISKEDLLNCRKYQGCLNKDKAKLKVVCCSGIMSKPDGEVITSFCCLNLYDDNPFECICEISYIKTLSNVGIKEESACLTELCNKFGADYIVVPFTFLSSNIKVDCPVFVIQSRVISKRDDFHVIRKYIQSGNIRFSENPNVDMFLDGFEGIKVNTDESNICKIYNEVNSSMSEFLACSFGSYFAYIYLNEHKGESSGRT